MENKSFTISVLTAHTAAEVFNAINNVRDWWSEEIEGATEKFNDEFEYHYLDVHRCKMRIIESVPGKRVVWLVLENYFSFTQDKSEWTGTKVIFEIKQQGNQTALHFTHEGLVPENECYNACVNGWTQYIQHSLTSLIATGKGQPNSKKANTIHEVALKFNELARQEKWFEIQEELFAADVNSIEPANSPYFNNATGKDAVRKKGEDWVKRIEAVHRLHTTDAVIGGNYFAVGREVDITVQALGRIQINQVMLYEVKDGQIISEQFFY